MEKTEDEKCEPKIALAWTVLKMLFKIIWGIVQMSFNINTPSVLTDQLSALEAATTSEMVRLNLNALHAVRKSFREAESNEKIWRALRSNVRTYVNEEFVTDDSYYRRQNCKGWHSPAKILGKDGQCVLIRHSGAFYKMHPYHLMKANKEFGFSRDEGNRTTKNEINEVLVEEDEGHYNKSLHVNREELKDNSKLRLSHGI